MKKILIAAVMLLCLCNVYSQPFARQIPRYDRPIDFRVGVSGAFNFSHQTPIAAAFVSAQGCNIMGELEVGWSHAKQPYKSFFYANPSLGFYYGEHYRIYALIGLTNWTAYDDRRETSEASYMWWKLKLGIDIPLTANLFFNVNWCYLLDSSYRHAVPYHLNAIAVGIGWNF